MNTLKIQFFSKPLVATGGVEKKICVYSLNDKKELLSHKDLPSVPSCLAFDRDDISLVNGAENGQIQIWDLKSQTAKPRTLSGHRAQVKHKKWQNRLDHPKGPSNRVLIFLFAH